MLGLLGATCGKIGREIYILMKTEYGEVEEPVPEGTVGSSTMPQKRNPQLCQDILSRYGNGSLGPQALNLGSGPMYCMIRFMPSISLSAVLNPEESGGYVALCPELDIASQGESIEQAMHNLKEAVEGFFEVASPAEIETRLKRPALFTHFEVSRA